MKAGDKYTPKYISSMCQLQVELVEGIGVGLWKVILRERHEGRTSETEHQMKAEDLADWRLMDADEIWPITIHNIKPHVKIIHEEEKQKFDKARTEREK